MRLKKKKKDLENKREKTEEEEIKEKEARDKRELTDFGKFQQCPWSTYPAIAI